MTIAHRSLTSRQLAAFVLGAAGLAATLMLWSRRDYVPVWDGRIYADCVIDASQHLLDVGGYRCAGHISQSYVALLALAQTAAPASLVPMLAMNAVLLALGALSLWRLTRKAFPDEEHRVGSALVVASFLVHPVVLASAVQPGLDFGMLIFSLCTLAAAVERRRWAVVVFGTLLVFSKEPGVLVYGVIVLVTLWRDGLRRAIPNGAYWFAVAAVTGIALLNIQRINLASAIVSVIALAVLLERRARPARIPWAAMWRELWPQWSLALPVIILGTYIGANAARGMIAARVTTAAHAPPVVWSNAGAGALVRTLFRPGVMESFTLSTFALMLIVGFLWILTTFMALDAIIGMIRRGRGCAPRPVSGANLEILALVTAALVGEIWLLSRYVTFANARYYLPVYPLALVVGYAALVRLDVKPAMRSGLMALVAVLLGVSAVRTIDPVSRAMWGTFPALDKPMLVVTSLTRECCGAGRDQLVYNLEFTHFGDLTSDATEQIRPDSTTTIILPAMADWYAVDALDATTRRRTLARHGTVMPRVIDARVAMDPDAVVPSAWYFELPYMNNSQSLTWLNERYDISDLAMVTRNGYAIGVRRLRLRAMPLGRPASNAPNAAAVGGVPR